MKASEVEMIIQIIGKMIEIERITLLAQQEQYLTDTYSWRLLVLADEIKDIKEKLEEQ